MAPADLSAEAIEDCEAALTSAGCSGLALRRVGATEGAEEAIARLREAARLHAVHALFGEMSVADAVDRLRESGVEPLVVKGWGIARLYADPALRPYSDIDVVVRPADFDAAREAIRSRDARWLGVDLHEGGDRLYDVPTGETFERATLVRAGETEVRIPSPEDHIRLVVFHMLHHGLWRPLWLVDVAVAVEAAAATFDWDRSLGADPVARDWMLRSFGLAHRLLGARLPETPHVAAAACEPPDWLVEAVLVNWGRCSGLSRKPPVHALVRRHWRAPRTVLHDLYLRWDRPIEASVELGVPFDDRGRAPVQLRAAARGLLRALGR